MNMDQSDRTSGTQVEPHISFLFSALVGTIILFHFPLKRLNMKEKRTRQDLELVLTFFFLSFNVPVRSSTIKRLNKKELTSRPVGLSFHGLDALWLS